MPTKGPRLRNKAMSLPADLSTPSFKRRMSLEHCLGLLTLCLVGLGLFSSCGGGDDEELPPSIILISLDTLRGDHVGFMGYERDTTPFLDEIAAESMVFERAYTTMSWTLIAHMSLMTGFYPSQHKVWKEDSVLTEDIPTLTQKLKDRGYHNMGFHYPGWLNPSYGFGRDFDVYKSHSNVKQAGAHIREAMAKRPKDKPYFLFIHLFDIHNGFLDIEPARLYTAPPPYDDFFYEGATELLSETRPFQLWNMADHGLTPDQHDAVIAQYDGGIRYVDDEIRSWVDDWRESDNFEDALFIVTSDHGEGLAQRRRKYGGHGDTYEEGLHVPLIMRFPDGLNANVRVPSMVSHVDVVPTVLDYLNYPDDERYPGYSLLRGRPQDALLVAEKTTVEVYYQWPHKLVRKRDTADANGHISNLVEHPNEDVKIDAVNSGKDFIEKANSLRAFAESEMETWYWPDAAENTGAGPLSEEERKALEGLGYTGDD